MARRKIEEDEPEVSASDDPELQAIAVCVAALDDLDEEQQRNVVVYLRRRFGLNE